MGGGGTSIALLRFKLDTICWCVVNVTPRPLYPLEETRYPQRSRRGGPQGRSGRVQKISPPPGFDYQTVQPVASSYTDWTNTAHPKRLIPYKSVARCSTLWSVGRQVSSVELKRVLGWQLQNKLLTDYRFCAPRLSVWLISFWCLYVYKSINATLYNFNTITVL